MPKPEILDPQGKAITNALSRLGYTRIVGVRQGKHFEFEVDDRFSDDDLSAMIQEVLANPLIEDWTIRRLQS